MSIKTLKDKVTKLAREADLKKRNKCYVFIAKNDEDLDRQLEKKCLSRDSENVYAMCTDRFSITNLTCYELATPQQVEERMSRLGLLPSDL